MNEAFDPRTTPVRGDLAAATLRGRMSRPRYAEGEERQVIEAALPLSFRAEAEARLESELAYGERFTVYEVLDGWAWGQAARDGYVGYVPAAGLSSELWAPTHVMAVPASFVYPEPDLKCRPRLRLGMEARVCVTEVADGFAAITGGGWIFADHLAPLGRVEANYLETASRFLGVPYLWGGRGPLGLDCSALVQLALWRAGIEAPRDSDQQARQIGAAVDGFGEPSALAAGDLVFFPGHVGFVLDGSRFLHANAFRMAVTVEALATVLERARAGGAPAASARRIWNGTPRAGGGNLQ